MPHGAPWTLQTPAIHRASVEGNALSIARADRLTLTASGRRDGALEVHVFVIVRPGSGFGNLRCPTLG